MRLLRKMCQGAVAGLAGSAAMHGFRLCWEAAVNHNRESGIFGFDREADVSSARVVYSWFSRDGLAEPQAAKIGLGLHYAYGALIGIGYRVTSSDSTWLARGQGGVLGGVLWICADEVPISLSGISNPFRRTAASHASALLAHLLFGVTVDRALGSLHRADR